MPVIIYVSLRVTQFYVIACPGCLQPFFEKKKKKGRRERKGKKEAGTGREEERGEKAKEGRGGEERGAEEGGRGAGGRPCLFHFPTSPPRLILHTEVDI